MESRSRWKPSIRSLECLGSTRFGIPCRVRQQSRGDRFSSSGKRRKNFRVGKSISPVVLGQYLFVYKDNLDAVSHYQLVQRDRNRACFMVVPAPGWNPQHREQLERDLNELLGSEMEVTIETVSEIPHESSGKRPIIKVHQLAT